MSVPRIESCPRVCREVSRTRDAAQRAVVESVPHGAQVPASLPRGPVEPEGNAAPDSKDWQTLLLHSASPSHLGAQCRLAEEYFEAYIAAAVCLRPDMRAAVEAWEEVRYHALMSMDLQHSMRSSGIHCILEVTDIVQYQICVVHVQLSVLRIAELWPGPKNVFLLSLMIMYWTQHISTVSNSKRLRGAVKVLCSSLQRQNLPAEYSAVPQFPADVPDGQVRTNLTHTCRVVVSCQRLGKPNKYSFTLYQLLPGCNAFTV